MIFLDRSNVNGTDNYALAKVTHLYLKVSEGTGFTDSTYTARKALAHAAGAIVGGYHFGGNSSPIAEADFFLSLVGSPKAGQLRPCLDLEGGQSAAWCADFVEHVHSKLGYWPVLYGNTSTIPTLRAASSAIRACPWWRAEYSVNDGQRHALSGGDQGCSAHQYTSVGSVPGISGHTDMSVFMDEAAMLIPTKAPPKPKAWTMKHRDKANVIVERPTKHPVLYQIAHRGAKYRGRITITPIE